LLLLASVVYTVTESKENNTSDNNFVILYGSALDDGLLSSKYPTHPLFTVPTGILIEAPLSEIP